MTRCSLIQDQYRHMEWADALVWKSVLDAGVAEDEKIHPWLLHLHMTQQAFLGVWQRQFVHATQQEIMEWSQKRNQLQGMDLMVSGMAYHQEVKQYLSDVQESLLIEPTVLPWMDMVAGQLGQTLAVPTLLETMIQVPMHSMHHRGQILARMRELSHEPPLIDYIAWVWLGKPDAAWLLQ